ARPKNRCRGPDGLGFHLGDVAQPPACPFPCLGAKALTAVNVSHRVGGTRSCSNVAVTCSLHLGISLCHKERNLQTIQNSYYQGNRKIFVNSVKIRSPDKLEETIRVTVDGEFLHYIFPFQFLDSPEWDSLRPTEEGIFQVRDNPTTQCPLTKQTNNMFLNK
uniref:Uncharacterized protein n=1 Tax=Castor canadensis TaxID=51338 RepID=A0A8C0XAA6_CASCN